MKTGLEFPKLLGVENPDAQLRCGDWLSLCGNKSRVVATSGEAYWDRIHNDAKEAYRRFVKSSPMERLTVALNGREEVPKWTRIRGVMC